MGFLNRIDTEKNAQKSTTKYVTNALKNISVKYDAFKNSFAFNNQAGVHNPVQFVYSFLNEDVIDNALNSNKMIKTMLSENSLSQSYNIDNVSSIVVSHLIPTARVAHKIYHNFKKIPDDNEYSTLIQAALVHDIGKVFIPCEILNKKGKLTPKERQIVELHNKFSYEILKTTTLKAQAVRLALEHHNYDNCFKRTHLNQILMIADIYCALREARPYKRALGDLSAKTILYDMGTSGMFDAGYIKYLW